MTKDYDLFISSPSVIKGGLEGVTWKSISCFSGEGETAGVERGENMCEQKRTCTLEEEGAFGGDVEEVLVENFTFFS